MHSGSCVFSSLTVLDAALTVFQVPYRDQKEAGSHFDISVLSWNVLKKITDLPKVNIRNSDIYKDNAPEVLVSTRFWPKSRSNVNWCSHKKTDHPHSPLSPLFHSAFLLWAHLPHFCDFLLCLYVCFPTFPPLLASTG